MGEMTVAELLSIAGDIGVVGLLFMAFYGGAREVWVWGVTHRREVTALQAQIAKEEARHLAELIKVEQDRDEWKAMAISATDIGKRVVSVAEKSVAS
jgi:hypothetical protein